MENLEEKDFDQENSGKESSSSEELIPEEILKSIPEEERGKVASIIKQTMVSGIMKRSNPIADKITTENILLNL